MRIPSWLTASAAAAALAGATWVARPASPTEAPLVLAVPASGAPSIASQPLASGPEWLAVVRSLDAARLTGYADPVAADPTRWIDAGCPCLREERARLDRLMRLGQAVRSAGATIQRVRVVEVAAARAVVEVTDVLPAYDVLEGGLPAVRYAGRGARTWRGVLVRTEGGWRWAELRPGGHDPVPGVDRADAG